MTSSPYPQSIKPRVVELRMEMTDADNKKIRAQAVIDEQQLIIAPDPRELLFKYLQEMAYKLVNEAFKEETREEAIERLRRIGTPPPAPELSPVDQNNVDELLAMANRTEEETND